MTHRSPSMSDKVLHDKMVNALQRASVILAALDQMLGGVEIDINAINKRTGETQQAASINVEHFVEEIEELLTAAGIS